MKPQNADFEHFYDDRVEAFRQLHARQTTLNQLTGPSIIVTILALLVTLFVRYYGTEIALQRGFTFIADGLWDTLVFITPTFLLTTLDTWINPPLFPQPMRETPSTHATKSELMRRVMGLDRDGGGMMASVFQARNRALSTTGSMLGYKIGSYRPPGLGNRDNSCYQNSILQGLAALPSFRTYLAGCIRNFDILDNGKDVSHTLQALLGDLNDRSNYGKTIWTPSLLKSMSTWTQQDAQEYYSKILDDIDKGVAKAVKASQRHAGFEGDAAKDDGAGSQHSDDSGYQSVSSSGKLSGSKPMRNPLEGLLAQRVACVQCGYSEGLSMIPFNCLTLSLGLDKSRHDLYERLDSYSKVEEIEGVECPKCTLLKAKRLLTRLVDKLDESGAAEKQLAEPRRRLHAVDAALEEDDFADKTMTEECKISPQAKVTTTKTKQIVIARPPQSLAIHMNRSVFDPSTFHMLKNSAPVDFPLTLDLGPWCLGSGDESGASSEVDKPTSGEGSEEQWQTDATVSMVAGDVGSSRLTGPIYELRAVVTHSGRHENGHYICYRKYPSPRWQNDKATEKASKEATHVVVDGEAKAAEELSETEPSTTDPDAREGEADAQMEWWRLSDHNVTEIDEDTVLCLSPGVFMLFYECVDPSILLQADTEGMLDAVENQPVDLASEGELGNGVQEEMQRVTIGAAEDDSEDRDRLAASRDGKSELAQAGLDGSSTSTKSQLDVAQRDANDSSTDATAMRDLD